MSAIATPTIQLGNAVKRFRELEEFCTEFAYTPTKSTGYDSVPGRTNTVHSEVEAQICAYDHANVSAALSAAIKAFRLSADAVEIATNDLAMAVARLDHDE